MHIGEPAPGPKKPDRKTLIPSVQPRIRLPSWPPLHPSDRRTRLRFPRSKRNPSVASSEASGLLVRRFVDDLAQAVNDPGAVEVKT